MTTRISLLTVGAAAALTCTALGEAVAADLRVGFHSYKENGAVAEYQVLDNQHLICDSCASVPGYKPPFSATFTQPINAASPVGAGPSAVINIDKPQIAGALAADHTFKAAGPNVDESVDEHTHSPIETIYFRLNSYVLGGAERVKLAAIVKKIKKGASVAGHACRLGSEGHNKTLSLRRARIVASYLKAHGVTVEDITAYGSTRPTGGSLKMDRRTVIMIREDKID